MQFIYNYNEEGEMVDVSIFFLLTISYYHVIYSIIYVMTILLCLSNFIGETRNY